MRFLVASMVMFSGAAAAGGLPTGANVGSGSVSVTSSGTVTTIDQSSQAAILNWQSFSIGKGDSVLVNQPGVSSTLLNRVTGNTPSTIAGSLIANGQVYLVNPNGIAITKTGTVKVGGGFIASTLDISDTGFLNGVAKFTGTGSSAAVSNAGAITVGRGGYAALLGGSVSNSGLIAAPMGKVALGSGEAVTLDFSGDGFLQVATPTANVGPGALIQQGGTIQADGGLVVMSAATARAAARNAVNMSGVIQADTISGKNGAIVIGGGDGGSVALSGHLNTTAEQGSGGSVIVTGKTIDVSGAIDTSGASGGGTVTIGGGAHGAHLPGLTTASSVSIDPASTIKADALSSGNGGTVTVWSNDATNFQGAISAQALGASGNGGNAEVSGGNSHLSRRHQPAGCAWCHGQPAARPVERHYLHRRRQRPFGRLYGDGDWRHDQHHHPPGRIGNRQCHRFDGLHRNRGRQYHVANPLTWSASTVLTLNAAGGIVLDAGITNSGTSSGLALTAAGTNGVSGNTSGTIANSGSLTFNVNNASASGTLAGVISGSGSLTKVGAGTLTLSGANTDSGTATVSAGTLIANINTTQDALGTGAASIASGATLRVNNTASSGSSTVTVANSFSGAGTLNLNFNNSNVSNTLMPNITGLTGNILLTSTGTTGDKWNIPGLGTLAASVTVSSGTTLYESSGSTTFSGGISIVGTGNSEGRGAIRLDSGGTLGGNISLAGNALVGSVSTGGTLTGSISNGTPSAVTLTIGNATTDPQPMTISGNISNGSGILSLTSLVNTTLSGANSYTGATNVNAGTLHAGSTSAFGSNSAVTIASGATLISMQLRSARARSPAPVS